MRYIPFLLLLLLFGCKVEEKKPKRPDYVLEPDSLAFVLAEVHKRGVLYRFKDVRQNRLQDFAEQDLVNLFDSLNIPKERLDSSLKYYKNDLMALGEAYDEALNILSTELAKEKGKIKESGDTTKLPKVKEKSIKEIMENEGFKINGKKIMTPEDIQRDTAAI